MFYITSKDPFISSRTGVHIGICEHPIPNRDCREVMDVIWIVVKNRVAKTPAAKSSIIGLAVIESSL